MLRATSWVPDAACWMLREISPVAAPCCSTAEAMPADASRARSITVAIPRISSTARSVTDWIERIWLVMSSVARPVWLARLLTSAATTAKPLPASPARAASIVALSAQQIGLIGDVADQLDDIADLQRLGRQLLDRAPGLLRALGGVRRGRRALVDPGRDLADRQQQLLGRGRDRLDVARGEVAGAHHVAAARLRVGHLGRHLLGALAHRLRGRDDRLQDARDRALELAYRLLEQP